jgi:hypothetical protein
MPTSDDPVQTQSEITETTVDREPSFARYVADQVVVFNLGRDMELSFIQFGPKLDFKKRVETDGKISEAFKLSSTLTEVARIRVSPETASQFAMNIIHQIAKTGELDTNALRENIETIIKSASEEEDGDDGA